jgi:hypothetical protein
MPACAGGCGAMVFTLGETCSNCKAKAMKTGLKQTGGPQKFVPPPLSQVNVALNPTVIPPKPVAPTLAPGQLPGGAVLNLKCRGRGQLAWIDVANASTLYILNGTVVEFKVDSTGGNVVLRGMIKYESATWGGTIPGAAGSGPTKSITCSTNSTSTLNPSTVTVTFGGQTQTVNVIVYTLNIVSTPADNFASRSKTDLGVDERVGLSFTTTPVGVTAVNAGGLLWRIPGGMVAARDTTGLLHDAGTHTGAPANDGLADYIAPNRTHAAGQQIQPSKEVRLQLSVVAGPSIGLGPEQQYRIHKPAAHMTQAPATALMHWNQGVAEPSAGFFGQIFFAPKNVSFRTLRWREGTGTMESSGVLAGMEHGLVHAATAHGDALHGTINGGNLATGCYVNQVDTVRSGGNPSVRSSGNPGGAVVTSGSRSTKVGQKKWPIKWEYTYAALDAANPNGGTNWTNDWIAMQLAHHIGTQYENGRFEIFKGHVGCSECMTAISRDLDHPHNWP